MKITFKSIVLCDDATLHASGLSTSFEPTVQRKDSLRGVNPAYDDRGNAVTTIAFRVSRVHANKQAAEDFYLTHPQAVGGVGQLDLVTGKTGSSTTYQDTAANCLVSGIENKGVNTVFSYRIQTKTLEAI